MTVRQPFAPGRVLGHTRVSMVAALPSADDGVSIVAAAVAAQEAATAEAALDVAAEEALQLSDAGALAASLRVHSSLSFADIYVLAGEGCAFECEVCDMPMGVGVSIEVTGHGLKKTMAL